MEKATENKTKAAKLKPKFTMSGCWLWLISAALLPVIVMLFLYSQNIKYVSIDWIPLICLILSLLSALIWFIAYVIIRSPMSAFFSVTICWAAFFTVNPIITHLLVPIGLTDNNLILVAVGAFIVAAAVGFFTRKLKNKSLISIFVLVLTSIVLLVNVASLIKKSHEGDNLDISKSMKTDFVVEEREEHPNVYWFHCDGMLSFAAMEKYFDDPQTDFTNGLNARGFEINRDAEFESGHSTLKALPCLMSPYAYDTWLSPLLSTCEAATAATLYKPLLQLRTRPELTNAFMKGGYHTAHQCMDIYILPTAETNYGGFTSSSLTSIELEEDAAENMLESMDRKNTDLFFAECSGYFSALMNIVIPNYASIDMESLAKPLSTYLDADTRLDIGLSEFGSNVVYAMANATNDILETNKTPRFSILYTLSTHFPFFIDEDGNIVREQDNMCVLDYPATHRFTAKTLLNIVDMILKADPDAVIVLQGDHGLQGNTEKDFQEAFGTEDAVLDMWNSVMSAIRVPDKYKNGEEHFALESPLNMSRYLVNNFVGHNYTYIGE